MSATAVMEPGVEVSDVTGQKVLAVSGMPEDVTVSELVQGLVGKMRLPLNDASGRPLSYHARLDREGRHLQGAERVAEAVRTGDRVVLQPNVDAGGLHVTSTVVGSTVVRRADPFVSAKL